MKMSRILVGMLLLGLVLGAAGCSKVPQEAVPSLEAALDSAKTAGAETYAPEALNRAQETYTQAKAEIEAQNGKFSLTRKYGKATELLAEANRQAEQANEAAVAGKEQAKVEATAAVADARTALGSATTLLAQAPRGKNTKAELDAMQQELTSLQSALDQADTAVTDGNYLDAKVKAEVVSRQAGEIQADINNAIAKVNAKR